MTTAQPRTASAAAPARPALLTRRVVRYLLALTAVFLFAGVAGALDQERLTVRLLATLLPFLLLAVMFLLAAFALRPVQDHSDLIDLGPQELF
ncbi:hypothetical protein [Deinococcus sp. 6GRE01]|uniref:hypothetical protein n=1 Tax=Deinococcus sp. 6GRE01 TaxID=2745873 RepID=UPI001E3791A0|nr:hypothetical protein [Deinococcus sp. 6GRE01]MCD0155982.1 hypothetical protein [Deinococcus sp. 6GRE01]